MAALRVFRAVGGCGAGYDRCVLPAVARGDHAEHGRRAAETEVLLKLYRGQLASFRQNAATAKKLLHVGESELDSKLDPAELAAWTMVASAILNLDETITKG